MKRCQVEFGVIFFSPYRSKDEWGDVHLPVAATFGTFPSGLSNHEGLSDG